MLTIPFLSASFVSSSSKKAIVSDQIQFDHFTSHEFTVRILSGPFASRFSLIQKALSSISNSKDWIPITLHIKGKETKVLIKAKEVEQKLGVSTENPLHKTQTKKKTPQECIYSKVKQLYLADAKEFLIRESSFGASSVTVSRFLSHFYDLILDLSMSLNDDEFKILALHLLTVLSEDLSDPLNCLSEDKFRIFLKAQIKALKDPEIARSLPFLRALLIPRYSLKKEDYAEILSLRNIQTKEIESLPHFPLFADKEALIWLVLFRYHKAFFSQVEDMSNLATRVFKFISSKFNDTEYENMLSKIASDDNYLEKLAATLVLFHKENRPWNRRAVRRVANSIQLSSPSKELLTVRFYFHLQESSFNSAFSHNPKNHPAWQVAEQCIPFYDLAKHPELKDLPLYLDLIFSQEESTISEKSARILAELLVETLKQNPDIDSNSILSFFQKTRVLIYSSIKLDDGSVEPFLALYSIEEAVEFTKTATTGKPNRAYKINNMPFAVITDPSGQAYVKSQLVPGRGHFFSFGNPAEMCSCYLAKNDTPALLKSLYRNFEAFKALKGVEGIPQLNSEIFKFVESDQSFYFGFFTHLTQGPTLASLVEQGKVSLHQKLDYAKQIVAILKDMHERSILHTNLLLKFLYIDRETAKLSLLNIDTHINLKSSTNLIEDATKVNRNQFPPERIAWEQATSRDEESLRKILTPAYDVWVLGKLFGSLFFGKEAENALAPAASELSLEFIVNGMLEEDPKNRPVLDDVSHFLRIFSSRLLS